MKKYTRYVLILIVIIGIISPVFILQASEEYPNEKCNALENPTNTPCVQPYVLLAPLPCEEGTSSCPTGEFKTFDPRDDNSLGRYLNMMLRIFIGVSAVLAMAMIVLGGLEYMTSELISSKEAGKKKITGAILGLLLALGSYALLNTINPDLLNTDVKSLTSVTVKVEVELEPEFGVTSETITLQSNTGLITLKACDESQMVYITLFGKNVEVYRGVVKSLERINQRWLRGQENLRYPVSVIHGYRCKRVASNPEFWSAHAFGLALDINPNTNPYGQILIEDLPTGFPGLFTAEGWGWGGYWSSVKDPMHFSKYPLTEGGDGIMEFN